MLPKILPVLCGRGQEMMMGTDPMIMQLDRKGREIGQRAAQSGQQRQKQAFD